MKKIPVWASHRGIMYAMVDDEDFDMLKGYAWRLLSNGKGTSACIATTVSYRVNGVRRTKVIAMHHAILGYPPMDEDTHHMNVNIYDNRKFNLIFIKSKRHSSISGSS